MNLISRIPVIYTCLMCSCSNHDASINQIPGGAMSLDSAKEVNAIMATVEKETSSFYARNYNNWKDTYVQSNYAFQAWNNDDSTIDARTGWNEIDWELKKYMEKYPEEVTSHPRVERRNLICTFYGQSLAFLTWDQYNSDKELMNYWHSKEVRLMEKQDGHWKIACLSAFWDYKNLVPIKALK